MVYFFSAIFKPRSCTLRGIVVPEGRKRVAFRTPDNTSETTQSIPKKAAALVFIQQGHPAF
jgi:hypothetical protein